MVKNVTSTADMDSLNEKRFIQSIYSMLLAELCQFIISIFNTAHYFFKASCLLSVNYITILGFTNCYNFPVAYIYIISV